MMLNIWLDYWLERSMQLYLCKNCQLNWVFCEEVMFWLKEILIDVHQQCLQKRKRYVIFSLQKRKRYVIFSYQSERDHVIAKLCQFLFVLHRMWGIFTSPLNHSNDIDNRWEKLYPKWLVPTRTTSCIHIQHRNHFQWIYLLSSLFHSTSLVQWHRICVDDTLLSRGHIKFTYQIKKRRHLLGCFS